MYVISARNVNDAWAQAKIFLNANHRVRPSRVGEVWECPEPVTTHYWRPMERVLFDPLRNCNPTFHFMEGLWMLAGRNDSQWISQFNKRMLEFTDKDWDGGNTFHGAYGYRWRNYFDMEGGGEEDFPDQLSKIVRMLKKSPDERRAVLQMWDSVGDLERPELKDIPCLGGDTIVMSPEGDIPISDLAQQFNSGVLNRYPVYAVNSDTGDLRLQWCTKAWKSGVKPVLEIGFNDGTTLRCTKEHVLFQKGSVDYGPRTDGRIVRQKTSLTLLPTEAQNLKVGDRVWATQIFKNHKGYLEVKRNIRQNTAFQNMQKIHRAYAELANGGPISLDFDIHHSTENKQHNKLQDLAVVDHGQHSSEKMVGNKNPMRNLTPDQHKRRACKQGASLRKNWEGRSVSERESFSRSLSKAKTEYWASLSDEEKTAQSKHLADFSRTPEQRERIRQSKLEYWNKLPPEKRRMSSEVRSRMSASQKNRWSNMSTEMRSAQTKKKSRRTPAEQNLFGSNHKIVSIRELPAEAVYDFEIPGFHTALVGSGVVVHNCNTNAYFKIREGKLTMTVCCRSNDLVWGAMGSNVVHFSMLQEYVAARIGVPVGSYWQISDSWHAYTERWEQYGGNVYAVPPDPYASDLVAGIIRPYPMVVDPETWDEDLKVWMQSTESGPDRGRPTFSNPFFPEVAQPLFDAWLAYKRKDYGEALESIKNCQALDWRLACQQWISRIMRNREK